MNINTTFCSESPCFFAGFVIACSEGKGQISFRHPANTIVDETRQILECALPVSERAEQQEEEMRTEAFLALVKNELSWLILQSP